MQSPQELEEEDREAQAAKLQELIRRGTPRDLAQAQELMKIMSGAEPENKPDYATRTQKELDKVQSRAVLLNNMLDNANDGEKFARGDAYDQIASHLRSIQPRLQKWISEGEEGEMEHMDRLLLINDLINQVIERYQACRKGDFSKLVTIDASIDPSKGGADAVPTAKITDLISFDDEEPQAASSGAAASTGGQASALDDFASLTFDDNAAQNNNGAASASASAGPGGLPADLFNSSNLSRPTNTSTGAPSFGYGGALHLPLSGASNPQQAGNGGGSGPGTSAPHSTPGTPLRAMTPSQQAGTPTQQRQQQQQQQGKATQGQKPSDPFADLAQW